MSCRGLFLNVASRCFVLTGQANLNREAAHLVFYDEDGTQHRMERPNNCFGGGLQAKVCINSTQAQGQAKQHSIYVELLRSSFGNLYAVACFTDTQHTIIEDSLEEQTLDCFTEFVPFRSFLQASHSQLPSTMLDTCL